MLDPVRHHMMMFLHNGDNKGFRIIGCSRSGQNGGQSDALTDHEQSHGYGRKEHKRSASEHSYALHSHALAPNAGQVVKGFKSFFFLHVS